MTSESPKEIFWNGMDYASTMPFAGGLSYTLTAHAQAMVAAERDACASAAFRACKSVEAGYRDENERLAQRIENELRLEVVKAIRARTPDEAQAALDALLRAERVKALREAASKASAMRDEAPTSPAMQHGDRIESAILALIEGKETGQ